MPSPSPKTDTGPPIPSSIDRTGPPPLPFTHSATKSRRLWENSSSGMVSSCVMTGGWIEGQIRWCSGAATDRQAGTYGGGGGIVGLTGHAEVELVLDGLLVGELPRGERPQAQAEGPDVRLGRQLVYCCRPADWCGSVERRTRGRLVRA